MRVAAIQMNSGEDVAANLELADKLLGEAAGDGCTLAVLPENFALMPERGRDKAKAAEEPGEGPIQSFLSEASHGHGLWIIAGSIPLVSPEIDAERVYTRRCAGDLQQDTPVRCRSCGQTGVLSRVALNVPR